MKFWPFLGTITYPKDNFCFHESIFQCKLSLFLTEVSFEASEENQLSYFQKGYFLKILWWFHQPHNQVKCRQKNKMFSEVFTKWTIVLKIVTFLTGQSLVWIYLKKNINTYAGAWNRNALLKSNSTCLSTNN